jgi:hypothetical protein
MDGFPNELKCSWLAEPPTHAFNMTTIKKEVHPQYFLLLKYHFMVVRSLLIISESRTKEARTHTSRRKCVSLKIVVLRSFPSPLIVFPVLS